MTIYNMMAVQPKLSLHNKILEYHSLCFTCFLTSFFLIPLPCIPTGCSAYASVSISASVANTYEILLSDQSVSCPKSPANSTSYSTADPSNSVRTVESRPGEGSL